MKKTLLGSILLPSALALFPATPAQAQSAYFQAVTNLNPAGYWPMHEVADPVPGDVETNLGTLGPLANGYYADWLPMTPLTTHQVAGALAGDTDTAAAFNGAKNAGGQGYLLVPKTSSAMTIKPPFTIEAWAFPSNTVYADMVSQFGFAQNGANTGSRYGCRLIWDGRFHLEFGTSGGSAGVVGTSHSALQWYHVVVTCDGSSGTVWVNGISENTGAVTPNWDPALPLTVGNGFWAGGGPQRAYNGAVDEVAVYNYVLPDAKIQAHYDSGTNASPSTPYKDTILADTPLVYLRMNGPAYTPPARSTWPVMTNYGSIALNGAYSPGAIPGSVVGPNLGGVPFAGMGDLNVMPGNGMSSYATAGFDPTFNPTTTPFSYGGWFRGNPADSRNFQTIMGHSDSSWRAAINNTGKLQVHGAGGPDLTSTVAYNDGLWHQFMVTAFPSNSVTLAPGTNILYVDGSLVASNLARTIDVGTNADVVLGNDPQFLNGTTIGRSFAGQLCEAAFWTRVLSPVEVRSLWNAAGVPPQIRTQPVSASANQGAAFTNTILAAGSDPLSYQWYQNSLPRGDQTGPSLVLNPVQSGDAGSYFVVVTNNFGAVTSSVVTLTVYSSPIVGSYLPVTYTNLFLLYAGANPTFSILSASGAAPIYYQWYSNGALLAGATNASVTLSNVALGGLTTYCVLSNFVGVTTSYVWTASVIPAPTSPYGRSVMDLKPTAYWRLNEPEDALNPGNPGAIAHDYAGGNNGVYTNVLLGQSGYNTISDPGTTAAQVGSFATAESGALGIAAPDFSAPTNTSRAFSVAVWVNGAAQSTDAGIVTRGYGAGGEQFNLDCGGNTGASHAFRFFVRNASGMAGYGTSTRVPDGFWHQLVGVCDQPNGTVTLYVDGLAAASGAFASGGGILASTSPVSLGTRRQNATSAYNYQFVGNINDVVFYDYALTAAQVASNYLVAGVSPQIIQQPPATASVAEGGTLTLSAAAFGTEPLSYQWLDSFGNTALFAAQTNATLLLSNIPGTLNGDSLYLSVTNLYGSVLSTPVVLSVVSGPPQITVSNLPPHVLVPSGKAYTYFVQVVGTVPFSYQWFQGGAPLAAETNATLTVTAGSPGASVTYSVLVTNIHGSATGSSVLTAIAPLTDRYGTNILALHPAGYWPLQETYAPPAVTLETNLGTLGSLGNAYYAVANADGIGTVAGTMQFGAGGATADYDPCVQFTAPSGINYAFVPRVSPALTLLPPLSMECWVNSSSTAFSDIMGYGGAPGDGSGNWGGLRLSWNRANNAQAYYYYGSGGNYYSLSGGTGSLGPGIWHHCVLTYDGTNLVLYTDGVLQNSVVATIAPNPWTPFTMGDSRWDSRPTRAYSGLLDEVAVYTNVLTLAQVQAHYDAGTNSTGNYPQTITNDHPQLYFRMNCPGFATPDPLTFPTVVNYGSASVNGTYVPGIVPGGVPGPSIAGLTPSLAAPINGVISCVHAGNDPAFNPTGTQPFTAMTWFRTYPSDNAVETLLSHGLVNWAMNLDGATGRIVWNLYNGGQVTSTNVLNDGQWHMVAGVFDGTTSYLYLDGALNSSGAVATGLVGSPDTELYLGGNAAMTDVSSNERYFAGALAHAAFFTNALTGQQIQDLYNIAVVTRPLISIRQSGSSSVITFTGTLLSSPTVGGTYSPVSGATSPYTVPQGEPQRFYRSSNP